MKTTLFFFSLFISGVSICQNNMLNNGSFENWSTTTIADSPDDWVSSNLYFPGTVSKETDAQDQSFAVQLKTISDGIDTIFAYVSFGDVGEMEPVAYSDPIDSLIFYAKYDLNPGDSALALVIQYTSAGPIYNVKTYGGTNTTSYQRMALNLNAPTQDSIIVGFASANAFMDDGIPGSWTQIDNVSFNHPTSTPSPLPNPSFENWTSLSSTEADDWSSSNEYMIALGEPENVVKTSDAYSGSFAAQLKTELSSQGIIPGMMTNGSPFGQGASFTGSPTSFSGAYKYTNVSNDTAFIFIELTANGNMVGFNYLEETNNVSSYTTFNLPLFLSAQPDKMTIFCSSGENEGSTLIVDDFVLSNGNANISKTPFRKLKLYPNPVNEKLNLIYNANGTLAKIIGLNGNVVFSKPLSGFSSSIDVSFLKKGVYWLEVDTPNGIIKERFIKH